MRPTVLRPRRRKKSKLQSNALAIKAITGSVLAGASGFFCLQARASGTAVCCGGTMIPARHGYSLLSFQPM